MEKRFIAAQDRIFRGLITYNASCTRQHVLIVSDLDRASADRKQAAIAPITRAKATAAVVPRDHVLGASKDTYSWVLVMYHAFFG